MIAELPPAWDRWAADAGTADGWLSSPAPIGSRGRPGARARPAPFLQSRVLPDGAGLEVKLRGPDGETWWQVTLIPAARPPC